MGGVFDKIKAEKSEIDSLLDKGVAFNIGKRSFTIKQPAYGTLVHLSRLFIEMGFDEEKLQEDPLGESKKMVLQVAKPCAKVVAVAVLRDYWKIKLFSGVFWRYVYWRANPSDMLKLTLIINQMCNYGDFINSIRLMSAARVTAPARIEKSGQA